MKSLYIEAYRKYFTTGDATRITIPLYGINKIVPSEFVELDLTHIFNIEVFG